MRSRMLAAAVVAAMSALSALPVGAQTYPAHAVRVIIPFAPGGSIDTLGRILAQQLGDLWGQSVFVENRPGAGGNIGFAAAAQAAPDGYTMAFGGQFIAANVTIAPMPGFDPVKSFDPIILVATGQDVLMVPPDSPFQSVNDIVAYAKAHPGELTFASLGVGSSGHLATTLFSEVTGITLQHVPYNSFSQAVTDVSTGRISLWLTTLGGVIGHIQAGKLRALAVSGPTRAAQLPDVPTFDELGVAYGNDTSWYALFAPAGAPPATIAKVNADTNRVIADADMKERAARLGFRLVGGSPQQLGMYLRGEIDKWAKIAKQGGLVAN
ncbi:MAG TPA: tripartite tricarboxylate transporter substrate binding protein [Xanthobacteraceae bacterium]|nr:tripartite tricarboxylate transporter substrate binding protein [Xanthobacteraceae bacterium]